MGDLKPCEQEVVMVVESTHHQEEKLPSIQSPSSTNEQWRNHEVVIKPSLKKTSMFQQPRNGSSVQGAISKGRRLSFADENGLTLETVKEFTSPKTSSTTATNFNSQSTVCVIS